MGNICIYLAGDSTVQTYARGSTQAGWGQFIADFFTEDVKFVNCAIGGRSSKTFVEEGRLDAILREMKAHDYLFVQMGHNDSTESKPERYTHPYTKYKQYLKKYVDGARRLKANPVLITPVARLHYENGRFMNDFPAYCEAMKQLVSEEGVPLIDLMTKSLEYYSSVGYDEVFKLFMVSENGDDFTHFTLKGARRIAKLVSQGVKELNRELANFVK